MPPRKAAGKTADDGPRPTDAELLQAISDYREAEAAHRAAYDRYFEARRVVVDALHRAGIRDFVGLHRI